MFFQPFHIEHFDLSATLKAPAVKKGAGYYHVFWWQHLPLGHLFIEPRQEYSEQQWRQQVAQAITPALEQYTGVAGGANEGKNWMKAQQEEEWTGWLAANLGRMPPLEPPPSVPVSVVICTRNRAAHLQQCLQSLTQLHCRPDEIVVVDNAPSDDTTQKTVALFPGVIYKREPRGGLDIARNTGVRAATKEIIAFTDDDVQVHPLWAFRVWETFEQRHTDALTGLVVSAQLETAAQWIFERFWSFNRGYTDRYYGPEYFQNNLKQGPPVWEIGAGANMAFRRSILEKTGYFNEILDAGAAGCCGDSELWFRILAAGGTIHYNPRVVAFHEHRKDLQGLKSQLFYYMRGHVTAALIQQQYWKKAGYRHHLMVHLPKYYAVKLKQGFPFYRWRYATLANEIRGVVSGYIYYLRHYRSALNNTAAKR